MKRGCWSRRSSRRATCGWRASPPTRRMCSRTSAAWRPGWCMRRRAKVFVLPGVPLEMKGIFTEELEPQFLSNGTAATVRELRFTFAVEARFYPLMKELEEKFPDVSVGSYPNYETKELVIRVLGSDPKRVEQVLDIVRGRSGELGMTGDSR